MANRPVVLASVICAACAAAVAALWVTALAAATCSESCSHFVRRQLAEILQRVGVGTRDTFTS